MSVNKEKDGKFPYEFHELDPEINEELKRDFRGSKSGFIQVGPEKYLFPREYKDEAAKIYNFEVRPTDVWIVTYPRSGTTWTQEMLWMIANDLDYEGASKVSLVDRFPFLEFHMLLHPEMMKQFKRELANSPEKQAQIDEVAKGSLKMLEAQTSRRFIKTHLPFSLLPPDLLTKGCKVVYVARNPLDAAVSYYHLHRSIRIMDYVGTFEKFWEYFKKDLISWNPYWSHIKEGWERRHEKNLKFLFYEDMNKDLKRAIRSVAEFLGKSLTAQQLDKLEDHLKFENFKNNKSVNISVLRDLGFFNEKGESFVRKGKSGGWKDYFSEEQVKEVEEWVREKQKDIGIEFRI